MTGKWMSAAGMLFSIACVAGASIVMAEETEELEEIVVMSTPIIDGNLVDAYGSTATIVSEEQIRGLNAQDIGTALRRTPGVNISRHNQIGSHGGAEGGAVFIRGMGAGRPGAEIKTFIDGVPMYQGIWNHPLLDLLSVDAAKAIEVHKSPQPQYFGNAFGSINLVPKRRVEQGFQTNVHLSGGNFGTLIQRAEHAGRIGGTDYFTGQSFRKSDGHRERADGQLNNYFARVGTELGNRWYVSGLGLRTDNYAWDPGSAGADPLSRDGKYGTDAWMGSIRLQHDHGFARGTIQAYVNHGKGQQLSRPDGRPDAVWNFQYRGIRAVEEFTLWAGGTVLGGIDFDVIEGDGGTADDLWNGPLNRIASPYGAVHQLIGDKEGFFVIPSAGVRIYSHNRYTSETSPHAGLIVGYKSNQLHFGFSRGVVYPGLEVAYISQQSMPALGDSWEQLDAEIMHHYELGISRTWERVRADLTFFRDQGKNRYVIDPPPPFPPAYTNFGNYRVQGIEATVSYSPTDDFSLFAGTTFLDTDPSDLPYAPSGSFSAGLNWRFLKGFQVGMDTQYVSERYVGARTRRDGFVNESTVESHFLLNGKLSYFYRPAVGDVNIEFFVFGENLADVNYEYKPGYPMPGINGTFGVTFRF
jgi:outer membrane cobalamin receptor